MSSEMGGAEKRNVEDVAVIVGLVGMHKRRLRSLSYLTHSTDDTGVPDHVAFGTDAIMEDRKSAQDRRRVCAKESVRSGRMDPVLKRTLADNTRLCAATLNLDIPYLSSCERWLVANRTIRWSFASRSGDECFHSSPYKRSAVHMSAASSLLGLTICLSLLCENPVGFFGCDQGSPWSASLPRTHVELQSTLSNGSGLLYTSLIDLLQRLATRPRPPAWGRPRTFPRIAATRHHRSRRERSVCNVREDLVSDCVYGLQTEHR